MSPGAAAPRHIASFLSVLRAIFVAGFVINSAPLMAAPPKVQSALAYRDPYVWHLADRLATGALLMVGMYDNSSFPPDIRFQVEGDFRMLYHRGLVACDGPLDEVALRMDKSQVMALRSLDDDALNKALVDAALTAEVQEVLLNWNRSIFPTYLEMVKSGHPPVGLPTCLNLNYVVPPVGIR